MGRGTLLSAIVLEAMAIWGSLSLFLWLAGDCSGKWPSNVTTNGHCWRTEGAQKMGESVSQDSGWKEGRRQCSAVEVVPHFSFFGKVHAAQSTERTEFTILGCERRFIGLTPSLRL